MASFKHSFFNIKSKYSICLLLSVCYNIATETYGQQMNPEDSKASQAPSDASKKLTFSKRGANVGMWFGPRLGKRAAQAHQEALQAMEGIGPLDITGMSTPWEQAESGATRDALRDLLLLEAGALAPQGDVETVGNGLEQADTGYGGLTIGSKRRFTPRLGRDSSEQGTLGMAIKNADFIPRLGRELSTDAFFRSLLVPREGDYFTSRGQFGRAVGDDRTAALADTRTPPFAPRLGRQLALQLQPLAELYGSALDLAAYRGNNPRVVRSADGTKKTKSAECVQLKKSSKP